MTLPGGTADLVRSGFFAEKLSKPFLMRVASIVVVLTAWQIAGQTKPTFLSSPSAIATAGWDLLVVDRRLLSAFGETLVGLGVGYAIAATLGIAVGFLMGRVRSIDIALLPYVNAMYATPRIALIPLLVLWVGIDFKLRVTIVILSSIFPIIITVRDGSKSVADRYLDLARSFVATGWQTWRTAILPGSLPFMFAALRFGAQRAMIGVIVAEMTSSVAGTGRLILTYGRFFQTERLMVPVVIIGVFSILVTAFINYLQKLATPWQKQSRGRAV